VSISKRQDFIGCRSKSVLLVGSKLKKKNTKTVFFTARLPSWKHKKWSSAFTPERRIIGTKWQESDSVRVSKNDIPWLAADKKYFHQNPVKMSR
jgi:hypothetical protein